MKTGPPEIDDEDEEDNEEPERPPIPPVAFAPPQPPPGYSPWNDLSLRKIIIVFGILALVWVGMSSLLSKSPDSGNERRAQTRRTQTPIPLTPAPAFSYAEQKRTVALLEKRKAEDGPKARALLADLMEKGYLARGMDVHVTAMGKGKKQLRIEWVLAGRPFSFQQGHDRELIDTLRAAGFESLYVLDGYQFGETWDIRR